VGSWQSKLAIIGCNCLPWQPIRAARLLLDDRMIEPYTIIIMGSELPMITRKCGGCNSRPHENTISRPRGHVTPRIYSAGRILLFRIK
jgi:hypothetical protein